MGVGAWLLLGRTPSSVWVPTSVLVSHAPTDSASPDAQRDAALGTISIKVAWPDSPELLTMSRSLTLDERGVAREVSTDGQTVQTTAIDAQGNATGYPGSTLTRTVTYDDQGRPTRIVTEGSDSLVPVRTFAYGSDGSTTITYSYLDGQIDSVRYVGSDGVTDRWEYFTEGRLTRTDEYDDGILARSTLYDESGAATTATCQVERDAQGRVISVSQSGPAEKPLFGIVRLAYDERGNVTSARVFAPVDGTSQQVLGVDVTYREVEDPTPLVRVLGENLV